MEADVTAIALPAPRRIDRRSARRLAAGGFVAAAVLLYLLFQGRWLLPHDNDADVFRMLAGVRDWVDDNKGTHPLFIYGFGPFRVLVAGLSELVFGALNSLSWPGLLLVSAALGFAAGGRRLAVLMVAGFLALGVLGLWEPSIATLGLTISAVILALMIGVPAGILAGRSDRFRQLIAPVLDVMQIMPAFAYLMPMVLLFGIGAPSAAIATLIFAMPAAIRITALGIRGVPEASVEAATSLGSTSWQVLRKVQVPLARRVIGLAINQTIMFALGMVVITAIIDAPGLGKNIVAALQTINVGVMFDAGLAIVILAIVLDRLTEQASERMDPRSRVARAATLGRRQILIGGLAVVGVALLLGRVVSPDEPFPTDVVSISFREPVNALTGWVETNLFWLTQGLKDVVSLSVLNPLEHVLVTSPWWLVMVVALGLALFVSGVRAALTATACLLLIAGLQLWEHALQTLASVVLATAITLGIGLLVGIFSARSDWFARVLRPLLDAAQTMPSFVYLLPAVALFGATRFSAIVAAVIYATPPVVRLVDAGIRAVPATLIEAATASGTTSRQLLWKVQLPVARPALLLAANQGIVLVLAMVVLGGLVGAGALGYDVVLGVAQYSQFGRGLAAGIAIVLLGIMLDRITQGAGRRRTATGETTA
jgi:glycine betaine/proline transport system permease protein